MMLCRCSLVGVSTGSAQLFCLLAEQFCLFAERSAVATGSLSAVRGWWRVSPPLALTRFGSCDGQQSHLFFFCGDALERRQFFFAQIDRHFFQFHVHCFVADFSCDSSRIKLRRFDRTRDDLTAFCFGVAPPVQFAPLLPQSPPPWLLRSIARAVGSCCP